MVVIILAGRGPRQPISGPFFGRPFTVGRVHGVQPLGTRILLIRHAETSDPGRFHGAESDVGLGARGRSQADHLARLLMKEGLDGVACSAMTRAVETARPLAELCGLPLRIVADLHERKMPSLSGRPKVEAWGIYEETMARWMTGDLSFSPDPADESYAEIRDRVVPAFVALAANFEGKTLAVVAHGLVIRVLLAELLATLGPADFGLIGIDHCALNDLRREGDAWTGVALNVVPEGMP